MGIKAQMKIQQMAFMVIALFFFFALVGIFVLGFSFNSLNKKALAFEKEETISSIDVIASMPELSCSSKESFCIDEDKLKVMTLQKKEDYKDFWPVSSIKVYKVFPKQSSVIKCPAQDCNYSEVYSNDQKNTREYSSFISLCKTLKQNNYAYKRCEIAKLVLGVKSNEE